jgi:cytidylate kinase
MNSHIKIIGIGGTNGSGKDSLGLMLQERYKFLFISVTDLLREEAKQRGWPIEREQLRTISAEWRRDSGLGVLVDKAVAAYEKVKDQYPGGVVMASLRNPGEADRIHELGGTMVWTDADPLVRYQRIYSRQRTAEDDKTFEQFLEEEKAEMTQSGDAATLNSSGVKAKADITIFNESNDIEEFKNLAAVQLQKYLEA